MTKETKSYQIYTSKVRYMVMHTQLLDASLSMSKNASAKKHWKKTIAQAINVKNPCSEIQAPNISSERNRVFAFSRSKIYEQTIIDLYRFFSEYMKNLIKEFLDGDYDSLLNSVAQNKDNKMEFIKILKLNDFDAIKDEMARIIFRRFENERSTPELLNKILTYACITIPESIKEDALLYLEIRHLIIHNASVADEAYKIRNTANKVELLDGDKISFTYKLFDNAVNAINALCQMLDTELLKKMLVKPRTGATK